MRLPIPLLFALCLAAPAAVAQTVVPKAYAPEDLSILRGEDRARVIDREYRDQSGGREIPDDQLEFYLDQVRSGWTFSAIKEDIARSLRGDRDTRYRRDRDYRDDRDRDRDDDYRGDRHRDDDRHDRRVVRCESVDERARECRTGFRGRATIVRQLSRAQCIEGRSWGQRPGLIWVNWGCRADFAETGGGWQAEHRYSVTCSSAYDRYHTCAWNSAWGPPVLSERLSRDECIQGRTWGYRNGSLWVDDGCRARFEPAPYDRW